MKGKNVKDLEIVVTDTLRDLGIPAHIRGYHYIRRAVMMAVEDMSIINSITKELYPRIANDFDTSSQRVERAIRHAVEVSWIDMCEGNNPVQKDTMIAYFGQGTVSSVRPPTNSQFIATIADRIRLNSK